MANIRVVIQKPVTLIDGDIEGGHANSIYLASQVVDGGNATN